ncbi:pyridoxal phosphate-dependent aminotransferase [Herbaspirillum seropedicae]|uniref:Pyridoxal phosphate dependent aspartate/tyrosine/aromatic aminotransferase protein n=1 Tax=Herbaspirillum seropedicae (strain SmR1) TaxID=757424 RepID=D8J0E4_HERSS|nr:pyridoxal phosphate-dependent aminotransferase [Herbaspirillum seropedicae]ADJ64500.1 pyridoxal phosphate dependent aspartate/tyrosine/aromatic aminotransferase protein [Herbaspirillum seropedicae SmR1]AKN66430.1 aminotransferase [Herbaspirillum seropedicae]AON55245.1 pyridoxal phosphate dependent aspartate/tyrosine/aromatic aminotransferase [Herbaspirillum seropedicae]NQE30467.1 aminotransferase [Herbaspirillum seropedicae]UMU22418.1 pyridoxal phosphate-dependent aminotransferase [Herbaspi
MSTPNIVTKLPKVGTTIFTVMSALASEKGAVNLGQGFPDFHCDPALVAAVTQAMQEGLNQYPPMAGVPVLREAIAEKVEKLYGHRYDPVSEITVTAGATQGILTSVLCAVHPGDEVIVIEPVYDCYVPAIELAGGVPVFVQMEVGAQGYSIPWDKVKAAVTPKTRMIMVNTPHNPTGSVMRAADVAALADIVRGTDILILSDEVYEHMVYDGQPHESLARHPELAERSFINSSFGKTYHVTGWKVGYVAAPAALTAEFRKVHQFNVFTVNTPVQYGLAAYMKDPAPYLDLPAFYQHKRDLFRTGLANTRFELLPSQGTYFQCVKYGAISALPEAEFCKWLTSEIGVAAIPVSAFYNTPRESGIVRFCFAKKDETLQLALERLAKL